MTKTKLMVAILALALFIVGIDAVLPVETRPQPANASDTLPFDHSNCQYPDRWSNPVDGCDNSDPAVPECIKAFSTKEGEDACIAQIISDQQPKPIPTVIEQPAVAECGGK
jgi:PBP1b-binding outer membrane lipoprotein LpoB